MSADQLCCRVRGLYPWPGTYTLINGEVLKIWKAEKAAGQGKAPGTILVADAKNGLVIQAGDDALQVIELQAQGGKRMNAKDYLRGHPISAKCCDPVEE